MGGFLDQVRRRVSAEFCNLICIISGKQVKLPEKKKQKAPSLFKGRWIYCPGGQESRKGWLRTRSSFLLWTTPLPLSRDHSPDAYRDWKKEADRLFFQSLFPITIKCKISRRRVSAEICKLICKICGRPLIFLKHAPHPGLRPPLRRRGMLTGKIVGATPNLEL